MGIVKDETGKRYGRLVVIGYDHKQKNRGFFWRCKCDCGKEVVVCGVELRRGDAKSCGCYARERFMKIVERKKENAKYEKPSRLRRIWGNMKGRCYYESSPSYKNYGARGIKVCDEWLKHSKPFQEWALSNGYKDNLTLDRIDVDGDYEPSNCRWITQKEQMRNKRDTVYIEYEGEKRPLIDVCEELGVNPNTAFYRIRDGRTDVSDILSKEKLNARYDADKRKKVAEISYVPYALEKNGEMLKFKSEKDACAFLGLSKCSVSKAYSKGAKIHGYTIHRLESFPKAE